MSLATKCTNCGTVFRVVQDQLKVSEGWVRCGRCDEVFNALEGLFDLERDTPPRQAVAAAEALVSTREDWIPSGHGALRNTGPGRLDAQPSRSFAPEPPTRGQPAEPPASAHAPEPEAYRHEPERPAHDQHGDERGHARGHEYDEEHEHERSEREGPPSLFDEHVVSADAYDESYQEHVDLDVEPPEAAPLPVPAFEDERAYPGDARYQDSAAAPAEADFPDARLNLNANLNPPPFTEPVADPVPAPPPAPEVIEPPPTFARTREPAYKDTPLMKATLTMLSIVLAIGLGLQALHHYRDEIAARSPGLAPMLSRWCEALGCSIEAPRHIENVRIESSALTPGAANSVNLSVVLRNQGETLVALPSIDLSLTDTTGKLLSRRALLPADFGVTEPVLASGAEFTLQAVLSTGEHRAAGYTVHIFYP